MKKETIILEIRASEGGEDSKLLVKDLLNIYIKSSKINNLEFKILESREGFSSIWIEGLKAKSIFKNESGCHKWVRIPPTEKRGRTQTSTITVALINPNNNLNFNFNKSEILKQYICSSGKGGQNVNRRSTCVQLTHIPTGIQVKCQDEREQKKNEEIAYKRLEEKLRLIEEGKFSKKVYEIRFNQIGNSERSDKRRTYRVKDDIVVDHITDKKCSFKDFQKGKIELLS